MALVAVAKDKFQKGFRPDRQDVAQAYRITDLVTALQQTYETDAHLVCYAVPGWESQPRINKQGLAAFGHPVEVGVFFCDVDHPDHQDWSMELMQQAIRQHQTLPVLQTTGIYFTKHGYRIVQPIETPIPAQEVEPYIRRWLASLESAGLAVDWHCADWTRHFRLPHIRRDDVGVRQNVHMNLERMRAIALEPIPESRWDEVLKPTRSGRPRVGCKVEWASTVPAEWQERIPAIAKAIGKVRTEWHSLFLALAGALLDLQVPPGEVPALCQAISLATQADSKTEDRIKAARSTVERVQAGQPHTAFCTLLADWPEVALTLDQAVAGTKKPTIVDKPAEPRVGVPAEISSRLEDVIRNAPDGLTVISAECGLGKSHSALKVAAERARKPYATEKAEGLRAPSFSKTSISIDQNKTAIENFQMLMRDGILAKRLFGPLSMKQEDGSPMCKYHRFAEPLVSGGQSIQWNFCRGKKGSPCEDFEICPAKDGMEGDEHSRVALGNHKLLKALNGEAGTTGLLVIDEPPQILETIPFTLRELRLTRELLREAFDWHYAEPMGVVLDAVYRWVKSEGILHEPTTVPGVLQMCGQDVLEDLTQWMIYANKADEGATPSEYLQTIKSDGFQTSPPILPRALAEAKHDVCYARRLGRASKVLSALYHACTSKIQVAARIEKLKKAPKSKKKRKGDRRYLLLTRVTLPLYDALRREGSVVVIDANAGMHLPIFEKIIGYKPFFHTFPAPDGAPIERTLLHYPHATRKNWLPRGRLALKPSLLRAVQAMFDWAKQEPNAKTLGIITIQILETALRAALTPDDPELQLKWKKLGQTRKTYREACAVFGPMVRSFPGELLFMHYGAVRGRNDLKGVDCLATLMDPWPNLQVVHDDMIFLGMPIGWQRRMVELCQAELEQAHGRLRVVHRTRPGRALHIGGVLPSGTGWTEGEVERRTLGIGRPANKASMTVEELQAIVQANGGIRATARKIGCDHSSLIRYLNGRALNEEMVQALARLK